MHRAPFARLCFAIAFAVLAQEARAGAPLPTLTAEQITVGNAADHLFAGTDADGGVDDWYLSNGIVELIVDDVGLQDDLPIGVTPPPKQSEAGFTGGSIIDLGLVGANNDQLVQMFTVGGLSTSNFLLFDSIEASSTATTATVAVSGNILGFDVSPEDLPVVTEYTVSAGDPFVTITTTVTNEAAVPATGPGLVGGLGGFLDVFVWTDKSLLPFSPLAERGFDHPILNFDDLPASLETPIFMAAVGSNGPADGVIDPVSGAVCGEASYGLLGVEVAVDPDGVGPTLPAVTPVDFLFGISNHQLTAFGNSPLATLQPSASLRYVRRLYVGNRNAVASVANPMLEAFATRTGDAMGSISGNVDASDGADVAASVVATIRSASFFWDDDAPLSHFRTGPDGAFSGVVLPEGTYDLEFRSVERPPVTVTGVVVAAGQDTAVTVPALAALGTVEIELVERRKGPDVPIPGKVVFKGRKGDPDPEFAKDIVALDTSDDGDSPVRQETFGGSFAQGNTAYLTGGATTLRVRPGRYEVYASRGLEYGVQRKTVTVKPGKTKRLKFAIDRLVQTPGALGADFHIHSARSLDSSAGLPARVAAYAGEGVEVMVSTDHDFHLDYAPVIDALDLGAFVGSIPGVEVTGSVPNPPAFPNSTGHINAWPMPIEPTARRDGSIEEEFVAPNWIFSRLRAKGAEVVQYNHVRAGVSGLTSIGFFNNIGYRRDLPITAVENEELLSDDVTGNSGVANPDGTRNVDFDVFEVGNGTNVSGWIQTKADWFSLLSQVNTPVPGGVVPFHPGTGVADSHRVTVESAGYFRTFVLESGDDPAALAVPAFDASILAGRMTATTGPYLEVSLSDGAGNTAGVGEVFVPADPNLTLHVRVQASNWVPVDEVRILVNGAVPVGLAFDATTNPKVKKTPKQRTSKNKKSVLRFDEEIPLQLSGTDAFVLVEAGAKLDPLPTDDPFASLLVPDYVAMSFTNPIFVDFGGDGFDPPGVSPATLAATLAPLETAAGRAALAEKRDEEAKSHPSLYRIQIPEEAALRAIRERGGVR
jgi:hypothetical protein